MKGTQKPLQHALKKTETPTEKLLRGDDKVQSQN